MNKDRRNELKKVVISLTNKIVPELINTNVHLEMVTDDEQFAYDCLPEGFQCSDRGCKMESIISDLSDQVSDLNTIIDSINDVIKVIEDVIDR